MLYKKKVNEFPTLEEYVLHVRLSVLKLTTKKTSFALLLVQLYYYNCCYFYHDSVWRVVLMTTNISNLSS